MKDSLRTIALSYPLLWFAKFWHLNASPPGGRSKLSIVSVKDETFDGGGVVVGFVVGVVVGFVVGVVVGFVVGNGFGFVVGDVVGEVVGDVVGEVVGDVVGEVVGVGEGLMGDPPDLHVLTQVGAFW